MVASTTMINSSAAVGLKLLYFWLLGAMLLGHHAGWSAEYYRWVDESGVVHFSDNLHGVPQKQRRSASRIKAKDSPKRVTRDHQPNRSEKASIPIEKRGNVIIVDALINKKKFGKFVIDTGASFTIIATTMARDLRLDLNRYLRKASLQTANGRIEAPLAQLDSVSVGGLEITDLTAAIHDVTPDSNISGLLGLDFLHHFRIDIDTHKGVLHLEKK